jgi:hypothetical protein
MLHIFLLCAALSLPGCALVTIDEMGSCGPSATGATPELGATTAAPPPGATRRNQGSGDGIIGKAYDLAAWTSCEPARMDAERRARERVFLERLEAQRQLEEIERR